MLTRRQMLTTSYRRDHRRWSGGQHRQLRGARVRGAAGDREGPLGPARNLRELATGGGGIGGSGAAP